jgi:hypothetical protein
MTYTYEKIKNVFEEKHCILLTTEEDFQENKMNAMSKYNIISACGHLREDVYFHTFKNRNSGVLCKECIKIPKENAIKIDNNETERIAFGVIKHLLNKEMFDINITNECVKSDLCIKLKEESKDMWLPFQLKSTLHPDKTTITFNIGKKNYDNMIMILICINPIKIYIINGNDKVIRNKERFTIGYKSKYAHYEVPIDKFNETILDNIKQNKEFLNTYEVLNTPITDECKLEREFQLFRISTFKNINFVLPNNYLKWDFVLMGYKIQERTINKRKNRNSFVVSFKHRESAKNKHYHVDDNDYYWLNFPDKIKFILIPSNVLFTNGYLKNNEETKRDMLSIDTNNIPSWLQPFIYEYKQETEEIILNIFNNLPPKQYIEDVIDIKHIFDNNHIELQKYKNRFLTKKTEIDNIIEDDKKCKAEEILDSKCKVEENLDSKVEEILDSKVEENLDSKVEEIVDSKVEEIVYSKVEEILDLDSKVEEFKNSKAEEIVDSKVEEIVDSKVEEIVDSKVEKIVNLKCKKTKKHLCIDCNAPLNKYNAVRCVVCRGKYQVIQSRENGRPSYLTLKELLKTKTFAEISEKYNVSRPCICKWLNLYIKHNLTDI